MNPVNSLFIGDYNAHHTYWSQGHPNSRGELLFDAVTYSNLIIVNPDSVTTTHNTNIDLCIATPDITPHIEHETLEYVSDVHFPQLIQLSFQYFIDKKYFIPQFKF